MSVFYKIYQNTNNLPSLHNKWIAKAVHTATIDLEGLAEVMQRNCTVKKSDIRAVLTELVETMQDQLQDSKRVRINGLGTFKLAIRSKAQESREAMTPDKIVGVRVTFQPETRIDKDKTRRRALVSGSRIQELPHYVRPNRNRP